MSSFIKALPRLGLCVGLFRYASATSECPNGFAAFDSGATCPVGFTAVTCPGDSRRKVDGACPTGYAVRPPTCTVSGELPAGYAFAAGGGANCASDGGSLADGETCTIECAAGASGAASGSAASTPFTCASGTGYTVPQADLGDCTAAATCTVSGELPAGYAFAAGGGANCATDGGSLADGETCTIECAAGASGAASGSAASTPFTCASGAGYTVPQADLGDCTPASERRLQDGAPVEFDIASCGCQAEEVETTAAPPAETTAAPAETTAAPPAETTAAPAETTAAPAENTAATAETTPAPAGASAEATGTANATNATATNTTDAPGTTYVVATSLSMEISLDVDALNATQKTAVANGLAYGLHAAACNGVSTMWESLRSCMLGEGTDGTAFGMSLAIDAQLSSTQPDVADYLPAETGLLRRRLSAVTLSNGADFEVTASSMDVATAAQAALTTAQGTGGSLDASSVITAVTTALQARSDAIGATALQSAVDAVAAATVTAAAPTVATVTPAPATTADSSGATARHMLGSMVIFMTAFWLLTC